MRRNDMVDQSIDKYIKIDEVADYLGVRPSTIRAWIKSKGMPHYRVGGKLLKFKRSEIDKWINTGESAKVDETNNCK